MNVIQPINAEDTLSHNLYGQKLGRKGRVTRERIIAATVDLLDEGIGAQLSLSAVARRASLGMTSLYLYFSDLTELLLAVLEPVMATAEESYVSSIREHWPDDELGERCLEFLRAYHTFWKQYSRILHLRNHMADRRDLRMMQQRIAATQPVIHLVVEQMRGDPQARNLPPYAMASVLMTGIDRNVTISTDEDLPALIGLDRNRSVDHYLLPSAQLLEFGIREMRKR